MSEGLKPRAYKNSAAFSWETNGMLERADLRRGLQRVCLLGALRRLHKDGDLKVAATTAARAADFRSRLTGRQAPVKRCLARCAGLASCVLFAGHDVSCPYEQNSYAR
ncbi:MAG TPA: hypothetical protein VJW94_06160 [Candidatus Acidoferrum sp.]|nr:hypothetical protein [Candidatus Acidoferrum sp.]